jgi:dTDP-4-dehydrorhamnose reductase
VRILITGASGQIGSELVAHCRSRGDDVLAASRRELDVSDRDAVLGVLTTQRLDVVVNCAAWTAVDACESDPERAYRDNALAVRWVAEGCVRSGAHLLQLSTDYVFDGTKPTPYHEWDVPSPGSVYGASKLAGEREAGPEATIVRTSWVCGANGSNMVKTILRLAADHRALSFVDDQRGHPSFAEDLAPMLRRLVMERRGGVHHVTNQGAVSWFEFAQAVMATAGHDPARVSPIATADLTPPRPARRPHNSVLDNAALRGGGIALLDDFRAPLERLVRVLRG